MILSCVPVTRHECMVRLLFSYSFMAFKFSSSKLI